MYSTLHTQCTLCTVHFTYCTVCAYAQVHTCQVERGRFYVTTHHVCSDHLSLLSLQLDSKTSDTRGPKQSKRIPMDQSLSYSSALHWVESLAMVTMCSYRPFTRKASLMILKEVRSLREVLIVSTQGDDSVMDVIEKATPIIISRYVDTLMPSEKVCTLVRVLS